MLNTYIPESYSKVNDLSKLRNLNSNLLKEIELITSQIKALEDEISKYTDEESKKGIFRKGMDLIMRNKNKAIGLGLGIVSNLTMGGIGGIGAIGTATQLMNRLK